MIPSDLELVKLVAASYVAKPTWESGAARFVATRYDADTTVLAFPGTNSNPLTWLADLSIAPWWDRRVGICHSGFLRCARIAVQAANDNLPATSRIALVGHSLGGATALIVGGMLIQMGRPVDIITTVGAPRAGSWKLRRVLKQVRRLRLYHNGNDPVSGVPWVPGLYIHPATLIQIGVPTFFRIWAHQIARYDAALEIFQARDMAA